MSFARDAITDALSAAGVETGLLCRVDSLAGIDHMSPRLDWRWCEACGQAEITVVIYDDLGIGEVAWAELIHVDRPHVLIDHLSLTS